MFSASVHENENEDEKKRCDNYKAHLYLINEAENLHYKKLKNCLLKLSKLEDPIERFQNSIDRDLPELEEKNLLSCVLLNSKLNDKKKYILLKIVFFRLGYSNFYLKLFQKPLLENMLKIERCYHLLITSYFNMYLESHQSGIDIDTERMIWRKLIEKDANNLNLLYYAINNEARRCHLLSDWMLSKPTANEIINAFQLIKKNFLLSNYVLQGFWKKAKNKILKMKLTHSNQSDINLENNNLNVHYFVSEHRDLPTFAAFFYKTRSCRINEMIEQGHFDEAERALEKEDRKDNTFNNTIGIAVDKRP